MKKIMFFLTILCCVFVAGAASGSPAPYSFNLDQFNFSGNGIGSHADGFNDASINPNMWEIYDPTIEESGTAIQFKSPGTIDSISFNQISIMSSMSYMQFNLNNSNPVLPDTTFMNGAGDYTITTIWDPTTLAENQFYIMNLSSIGVEPNENVNIGVANFDQDVADFFGVDAGPAVFFGRDQDITQGDYSFQSVSISANEFTGQILLRLFFDDANDEFFGSYSLDGTEGSLSTFSSSVSSTGDLIAAAELSLGGESWDVTTVPVPSSAILLFFGLAVLRIQRSFRNHL